jgi:hypothetical protein
VFAITGLAILKASYGVTQRIVVSSDHLPYYPSQVALIDRNGRTISEYWHSGHLDFLALTDLDGDGRQEIVASGVANGYRQATLVVLDPDRVSGASVELARPELQIHGMGVAHERFRLLFPRSDLNLATSTYNAGKEITVSHGGIRVAVWECDLNPNCKVWYTFDQKMTLRSADPDDQMRDARAQFYRNSRNHPSFTDEDQKRFLKVRCIVGCPTDFVDVNTH